MNLVQFTLVYGISCSSEKKKLETKKLKTKLYNVLTLEILYKDPTDEYTWWRQASEPISKLPVPIPAPMCTYPKGYLCSDTPGLLANRRLLFTTKENSKRKSRLPLIKPQSFHMPILTAYFPRVGRQFAFQSASEADYKDCDVCIVEIQWLHVLSPFSWMCPAHLPPSPKSCS
ncbi:hypothetical protein J6590_094947 [Homalodisca vitripennis]|nr:hypothetical protein J6590_094947 [Homalodisca vitripennis]